MMKTVTLDVRPPQRGIADANRDLTAVHADVTALLVAGVLDRTASGQVEFPDETVKVEFGLQAA